MPDYNEELERRVVQFQRYLESMDKRAHKMARGSCYLIFDDHIKQPDNGSDAAMLRRPVFPRVPTCW